MKRITLLAISAFFSIAFLAQAQPTYSKEVSRIIESKCQMCHRPNDIAPFPLLSYEDAQTWADDIKRVVSDKIMPPWKPVDGYGEFKDSLALSEADRLTLIQWAEAGAPQGDTADMPEPKAPTGDWQLGEPDMVVQMKEPYTPARGKDVYRCFVVSNPFDQTAYVKAIDVLPGNRQIVHHVLLFIDEKGATDKLNGADGEQGYTCFGGPGFDPSIGTVLGGWAPGTLPKVLPEKIAVQIPKGGRVVLQIHYFPVGRTGEDTTRVGLYLAKEKIEQRLFYIPVLNDKFEIPAGNSDYEVTANFAVPILLDAHVVNIGPHMHQLGQKIKVDYQAPGKEVKPLIYIDAWDFNWQGFYTYTEQLAVPAFSKVSVTCRYDNSENNPRNPNNPLKAVRWGEGTQDEMCITFLGVTLDNERILGGFLPPLTKNGNNR